MKKIIINYILKNLTKKLDNRTIDNNKLKSLIDLQFVKYNKNSKYILTNACINSLKNMNLKDLLFITIRIWLPKYD